MLFPIYFMVLISLKYEANVFIRPVQYLPIPITFENYIRVWRDSGFVTYFVNSVVVSLSSMISVTIFSILTAYSLSRFKYRGKTLVILFLLLTQMVPQALLLIPIFTVFHNLGLTNTLTSLVIMAVATNLAFCTVMMKGFFSTIPVELEEAAHIDGCRRLQGVIYVVLPVMLPCIVAVGAFAFVSAWNSYLLPLILLNDPSRYTLTIGLNLLIGAYTMRYTLLAAAGVLCLIPAVAMFAYMQKYMVSGLSAGAIKG